MSDDPRDWFRPTTDDKGGPAYWCTREGVVIIAMTGGSATVLKARTEIARIVAAWYRGEILPRSAAPTMSKVFEIDPADPQPTPEELAPPPLEIAGGVSGLQKLLIKMAEQNRGLDHAALKELIEAHEVVTLIWLDNPERADSHAFLTLKGVNHLLAQVKRGGKKIRATMTAIWCNSREHAKLLEQAFGEK